MTVREILETLDREISDSKARTIRLESVIERIMLCVRSEPTPAAKKPRAKAAKVGVLQLCRPEEKEETRTRKAA